MMLKIYRIPLLDKYTSNTFIQENLLVLALSITKYVSADFQQSFGPKAWFQLNKNASKLGSLKIN